MDMIGKAEPGWCATAHLKGEGVRLSSEDRAAGVEASGASTDSFYSHKHWFADRKTFPDEITITHPVVADTDAVAVITRGVPDGLTA